MICFQSRIFEIAKKKCQVSVRLRLSRLIFKFTSVAQHPRVTQRNGENKGRTNTRETKTNSMRLDISPAEDHVKFMVKHFQPFFEYVRQPNDLFSHNGQQCTAFFVLFLFYPPSAHLNKHLSRLRPARSEKTRR